MMETLGTRRLFVVLCLASALLVGLSGLLFSRAGASGVGNGHTAGAGEPGKPLVVKCGAESEKKAKTVARARVARDKEYLGQWERWSNSRAHHQEGAMPDGPAGDDLSSEAGALWAQCGVRGKTVGSTVSSDIAILNKARVLPARMDCAKEGEVLSRLDAYEQGLDAEEAKVAAMRNGWDGLWPKGGEGRLRDLIKDEGTAGRVEAGFVAMCDRYRGNG